MLSRIWRLAPARRSSPRRGAGVPAPGCESLCGPEDLKSLQECMPAGVGSGTVLDVHGSGVIVHYKSLSPVPLRSTTYHGDNLEAASVPARWIVGSSCADWCGFLCVSCYDLCTPQHVLQHPGRAQHGTDAGVTGAELCGAHVAYPSIVRSVASTWDMTMRLCSTSGAPKTSYTSVRLSGPIRSLSRMVPRCEWVSSVIRDRPVSTPAVRASSRIR